MLVHRVALGQLTGVHPADDPPGRLRVPLAERPHRVLLGDVLSPGQRVAAVVAEQPAQQVGDRVAARHRHDVRRRPLEHRHLPGRARQCGHQGDRGRAAADHQDALAHVVQVLRPVLRVDDRAGVALQPLELRGEAPVVPVVAHRAEQPVAGQRHLLAGVGAFDPDRPAGLGRRPGRVQHPVVVADPVLEAVLPDGLPQVRQDLRGVRDRLLLPPRLERVAEGVQVRVRADARIAEQVPGAAEIAPGLQDRETPARQLGRQVAARADPGDPGPDDQHVQVLDGRPGPVFAQCGSGGHGDSLAGGGRDSHIVGKAYGS